MTVERVNMNRIVILGQSLGVFELVQQLKNLQSSSEITIFSLDGHIPHNQDFLPDYLAKKVSKDQVCSADKDFYKTNNIELVLDQKLERVSLRQKKLTTESKEHIKFDTLVIADAPEYRWPDIKGVQKQGVYHVRSLGAADKVVQQLSFVKSIVIQVYDWNDVKSALALKAWGKEVTVVVPDDTRMARMLEHDVCETIMKSFQEESWSVYYSQVIMEVLGDSETKAVRLSSGKVLAADMVILGQMEPRLRILEDVAGENVTVVEVNADFQSKADHVYAFGEIADRSGENIRYWGLTPADWKNQAEHLARTISKLSSPNVSVGDPESSEVKSLKDTGSSTTFGSPRYEGTKAFEDDNKETNDSYSFDITNWSIKVLGDITPASNMVTFRSWNAETRVYQKIFTINGKIKGAVLLNLPCTDSYEHLLTEQISVAGYEKHVFDAALSWEQLKEALAQPLKDHADEEWDWSGHPEGDHQAAAQMQPSVQ